MIYTMSRINKTKNNLQQIWNDLDLVCGSLDNALANISRMVDIPDSIIKDIELVDITRIVSLKNEIEDLIEGKNK